MQLPLLLTLRATAAGRAVHSVPQPLHNPAHGRGIKCQKEYKDIYSGRKVRRLRWNMRAESRREQNKFRASGCLTRAASVRFGLLWFRDCG